ncbi:MAG: polyprenyl synthetase family protein [Desulfurococcaceae archaeon]
MNIESLLDLTVGLVNKRLKELFSEMYGEISAEAPHARDLAGVTEDYTLRGGKRLRAMLVLIGYWSKHWGTDVKQVLDVMAAVELLQSYLLIHDDIMDRDEMRRGGPTAHVSFARICSQKQWKDCNHYGVSQAIVAGDLLEAFAVRSLSSIRASGDLLNDLISTYSKGLRRVAYGQFLDVVYSQLPLGEVHEEDVVLVYKLKTSSYTVELPLHLGSIASGKYSAKLLGDLTNYAVPAGIAFQIRDDIIGLFGDPSVTGKPVGSDIKSKKKTLPVVKAHELSSDSDKKMLELVYNTLQEDEVSNEHVEEVRRIVRDSGGLKYSEEMIKIYLNNAKDALESSSELCEEAKEALKVLADRLSYRDK